VDALEFHVAVEQGTSFVVNPAASGQSYDVRGRNLKADPYEHLLQEEDQSGQAPRVLVLVLGKSSGDIKSFAVTDPPQPFIRDEVVRRVLSLVPIGSSGGVTGQSSGCYRVWQKASDKTNRWVLAVAGDLDCDGYKSPADCADDDPSVHPGASEVCDGKDNNCDGKYAPSQGCYATEAGGCRKGSRTCNEPTGGLSATCTVSAGAPAVPTAYCTAYADCTDASDPLACTNDKVQPLEAQCTAELETASGTICAGSIHLDPLAAGTGCSWELFETGGWDLGLTDGVAEPAQAISLCKPKLALKGGSAAGNGTATLEFKSNEAAVVARLAITSKTVPTCSAEPFSCALKQ